MTDVLRIALERRDQLHEEIERLDEFIRTAEQLIRETQSLPRAVPEEVETLGPARSNPMRRGGLASG